MIFKCFLLLNYTYIQVLACTDYEQCGVFAFWNNKLSSFGETDPSFNSSISKGITAVDTAYWNNKLNSFTETDPTFNASVAKGITANDTAIWNSILYLTDTILLSGRITGKLNIQDTASMLSNYRRAIDSKVNVSDTASMLSPYFSDVDTILLNLQDRLSTKVNISDTLNIK